MDGRAWRGLDNLSRVNRVLGYFDGVSTAFSALTILYAGDYPHIKVFDRVQEFLIVGAKPSFGELCDVVTGLYQDPVNRQILARDLMDVVALKFSSSSGNSPLGL